MIGLPVSTACRQPHSPWFPVTSIQVTTYGTSPCLGHDHKCASAVVILVGRLRLQPLPQEFSGVLPQLLYPCSFSGASAVDRPSRNRARRGESSTRAS